MELSLTKLLLLAVVVLIIFGAGKFPQAMKDLGKGIRSFKDGLNGGNSGDNKSSKASITEEEDKDKA